MLSITEYLTQAVEMGASDIHIISGHPVMVRNKGRLVAISESFMMPEESKELVFSMLNEQQKEQLMDVGETDFAYSISKLARFRVNAFRQRNSYAAAIRVVLTTPPDAETLGIPKEVIDLTNLRSGLVLVTGPTGSGKSTTLASLISHINRTKNENIITLEDPIEYLHRNDKCIVSQREIGADTQSYANALRAALRQDPDVILVGEMRDRETISIALTAAETGHLVFSTLHTVGAAKTIDRITDIFEPFQQPQVRTQLSTVLKGVVSQQLLPKADNSGRVAAFEIMFDSPAISNNIREAKTYQINSAIQTGRARGMVSMDLSLAELVRKRIVDFDTALSYSVNHEHFDKIVKGL